MVLRSFTFTPRLEPGGVNCRAHLGGEAGRVRPRLLLSHRRHQDRIRRRSDAYAVALGRCQDVPAQGRTRATSSGSPSTGSSSSQRLPELRLGVEHRADRAAIREAEVRDDAIEAIGEAITRFRSDLRATKQVALADGSVAEEPAMLITPRDLALLIDRLQVLFGRPSTISEGRAFAATITSGALPLDALQKIVELTRGIGTRPDRTSGLPHIRDKCPD